MTARVLSMGTRSIGTRLPALGARGEGWVMGQLTLIAALLASGLVGPALSGRPPVAAAIVGIALIVAGVGLVVAGIAWLRRPPRPQRHRVTLRRLEAEDRVVGRIGQPPQVHQQPQVIVRAYASSMGI